MRTRDTAVKAVHWGIRPQVSARGLPWMFAVLTILRTAAADPRGPAAAVAASPSLNAVPGLAPDAVIDAPVSTQPVTVRPATFTPSWDLDGTYLWLGPLGAAS